MRTYTYTAIDDPSALGTVAQDINDAGQIVGLHLQWSWLSLQRRQHRVKINQTTKLEEQV